MSILKKVLSVLIVISVILAMCGMASAAVNDDNLQFNSDGKFKILVLADCQDRADPYQAMINMIEYALDREKPDLVVFTGDNVVESSLSRFKSGAEKIIQPLIDRDVPYAYTFGNHDDEDGVSKADMHSVYMTLGTCLTYDADPSINGFGNCNIPIYSSDGSDIAFNLWIIDSLTYGDGGYDHVREDQLNWYKNTSKALEAQAGHKVNSLMFQHIALPEIYNLLVQSSSWSDHSYLGKRYKLELNSNASGYLGEFPCPPAKNGGQFSALKERGDVIGVVTGHDHSNAFRGTYDGVDFIQMPGMTFYSYGDDACRGYGVIELDESNTSTCTSRTFTYKEKDNNVIWNDTGYYGGATGTYISEISFASATGESSAKSALTNAGFIINGTDLNQGCGETTNYIYMGYKTTNDPTKAIRDIRFYSKKNDTDSGTFVAYVNGKECTYTRNGTDLNQGCGSKSNWIYACVSYDSTAGAPITAVNFSSNDSSSSPNSSYGDVCGYMDSPGTPSDLNESAGGNWIYCYTRELECVDITELRENAEAARALLGGDNLFAQGSDTALRTALADADELIADLEDDTVTTKVQSDIDAIVQAIKDGITELEYVYEVKFVNYDGSVIETNYVAYGEPVSCSIVPTKPSDEQYNYTFTGWDTDLSSVTGHLTVTALYEATHYHTSNGPVSCTEDEVCRFCGEVLRSATEHSWGEWELYIAPTIAEKGSERLCCNNCDAEQLRDVDRASTVEVEDDLIFGLRCNLAPEDIDAYFNEEYLSITKNSYNGKVMGTGSTITVTQGDAETVYTVVIFGDVNGDGWYDGQDALIAKSLANGMLTREDVGEAVYMAADCNHDGIIDENDIALLNEAGVLLASVDQSKSNAELETSSAYMKYISLIDQSVETDDVGEDEAATETSFFEWIVKMLEAIINTIIELVTSLIQG